MAVTVWKFKCGKKRECVMIYLGWLAQHLFQTAYCVPSYIAESKKLRRNITKQKQVFFSFFSDSLQVSRCDFGLSDQFYFEKH